MKNAAVLGFERTEAKDRRFSRAFNRNTVCSVLETVRGNDSRSVPVSACRPGKERKWKYSKRDGHGAVRGLHKFYGHFDLMELVLKTRHGELCPEFPGGKSYYIFKGFAEIALVREAYADGDVCQGIVGRQKQLLTFLDAYPA